MAKIVNVRLSGQEKTPVISNINGVDGKVNETSDNRLFVMLDITDDSNPLKFARRSVMYSTNDDGVWSGGTPNQLTGLIGKEYPGCVTITETVEEYELNGRKVNRYTMILLPHENKYKAFESNGHPIVDVETGESFISILAQKKEEKTVKTKMTD